MTEELKKDCLRAKALKDYFEEHEVKGFKVLEPKNEGAPTVFHTFLAFKGKKLPIAIVVDKTVYSLIQVEVMANVVNDDNREKILELLNTYNLQFKMFNYSIINKAIVLECSIIASDSKFEPAIFMAMLGQIESHLANIYASLMAELVVES
jgi:hypothetical protein